MKRAGCGFLLVLILSGSIAFAVDPVNKAAQDLALRGYDAVAYFTDGKPVKGNEQFTYQWKGATWEFAGAEHRDLFTKDPEKYAPQFGGYCAYAVSKGHTADADPRAWRIVNGKLYLNYSNKVQKLWEQDIPGNIGKADSNWPKLISK